MVHQESREAAQAAADDLRTFFGINRGETDIGLILGTGWGDVLPFDRDEVPLRKISGFARLPPDSPDGHRRLLSYSQVAGRRVIALRGRIHLYEGGERDRIPEMVRLQTEMFIQMGVKRLILTCAAGSLKASIKPDDLVAIDGFVTLFAPPLPFYGGEFGNPEDTLDGAMRQAAEKAASEMLNFNLYRGGYVMLRGPLFEGRVYDKPFLAQTKASVVGMSTLPEAGVASLYPDVRVLALAFVTNDAVEEHDHGKHLLRARNRAEELGEFLARVIANLPSTACP